MSVITLACFNANQGKMMEHEAFRIALAPSDTKQVLDIISLLGGKASEPMPSSSTANPLNAPVSGGDIQAYAEVVTAVFVAGSASIHFLRELKKLAREKKTRFEVTDTKTNKTTDVDGNTDGDSI
jgi:hypothetical protein